jgi:type VI secretion system protein ImpL
MNRILAVLKARWFLTLVGALLLAALVWFIGPLIAVADYRPLASDTARLVCVVLIMIAWGLANLLGQMQARQQNQRMIEAVTAETGERSTLEDTGREEEIAKIDERFRSALATLKQSRLGGATGRHYLYQLPWYILIGPPGAGKTTALINSGLKFPLEESTGKTAVKGVGGTRNCDWWFTDEAVLIDTAGRYTTQDSETSTDSAGWRGFLDLLKRHRRRQPINGVLIAISLKDLLDGTEQERQQHARAVRMRLRELQEAFRLRAPVYVLFTKADLIAGFSEFFDNLGREQRDQVWGVTFPVGENLVTEFDAADFGREYDLLLDRLNDHMLVRVQEETDVTRRNLIVGFPTQLASLRPVAGAFLDEVFRPSRLEDRALLRGFYFTSGTQSGTPVDRVMGAMAATFGLDPQRLSAHSGSGRSYFLNRLLRQVVFQEASLISADPRAERRRHWVQRGAYATAALAILAALGGWLVSYTGNEKLIRQVEAGAARYKEQLAGIDIARVADADLRRILPPLNTLRSIPTGWDHQDDAVPLDLRLGLYQGDKLGMAAVEAYHEALDGLMLPRLLVDLEDGIVRNISRPEPLYDELKVYLMLSSQGPLDKPMARHWMKANWDTIYRGEGNESGRTALQAHFDALIAMRLQPIPSDGELVKRARESLATLSPAERTYKLIKERAKADEIADWRIVDHGGPAAARVFGRKSGRPLSEGIPGLYTYDGFHKVFLPALDGIADAVSSESWVLRPAAEARMGAGELAKLKHEVLILYYNEYAAQWDSLFSDLMIVPFKSLQHAVEVLNSLSGPSAPLREILLAATKETTLTAPTERQAGKAAAEAGALAVAKQKVSGSGVIGSGIAASGALGPGTASSEPPPGKYIDDRFQPLHRLVTGEAGQPAAIDQTIAVLGKLYEQLHRVSALPNRNEAVSPNAPDAADDAILDLQTDASRLPAPANQWLAPVATQSRTIRLGGTRAHVEQLWKSNVLPFCHRALDKRYPFERSVGDVTLQDFTRLFAPNGLLDEFFRNNLQPFVDTSTQAWRWQRVENVDLGMSPNVLVQFQRAQQIRDAFFGSGPSAPLVRFEMQLLDLDASAKDVTVEIDGQTATFAHGPVKPQQLQWPGGAGLARVSFGSETGDTLPATGPWAWFRLLNQSDLHTTALTDRFTVRFSSGSKSASFEVRVGNVLNPFTMRELTAFRCPESF